MRSTLPASRGASSILLALLVAGPLRAAELRGRIIDALRESPQSVAQLHAHLTSLGLTLDTTKLTSIIDIAPVATIISSI